MKAIGKIVSVDNINRQVDVLFLATSSVFRCWILSLDKEQKMPDVDNYCYIEVFGTFRVITQFWDVNDLSENTYPNLKPGERVIRAGEAYILGTNKGDITMYDKGGVDYIKIKADEQKASIYAKNINLKTYGMLVDSIYEINISSEELANGELTISVTNPIPVTGGTTSISLKPNGDITIKNPKATIEIKNGTLEGEVVVTADRIKLVSDSADEPAVLGNILESWLKVHTHATGVGPSGPPLNNATISTIKSTKVVLS